MPNARILIADDDASILQTMSWVLKEHGYDVVAAREGARVLQHLEERAPDLVLLDVMFPDADGYQLLERIKSDPRWRDIPVLMVSSLPPEEAAVRTLGLGAADFVKKPFRVKELLARIQAQLRMRTILRSANDALHSVERELERARVEAESRRKLVDILHDVTNDLSSDEIYHLLARRVARALELTHCSVILARAGERPRVVATAFEQGGEKGLELELDRYPEIRAALESGRPVLVEDVRTSPLYAEVRERWHRDGTTVTTQSIIALPFALEPTQAGVFFLRRSINEPPLTQEDVEFADTVVKAAVAAVQRAQVLEMTMADNRRLEQLALTDPLTAVLNRRALTDRLAAEMGRVKRYESEVSLLLIDLDHFKDVNDNYGHLVGDDVLTEMASLLQQGVRAVDVVARYGGEEFVVVLPETGSVGAERFAERLREIIAAHEFSGGARGTLHLTASIGVAAYPSAGLESVEDFFAAADQALYRARQKGGIACGVRPLEGPMRRVGLMLLLSVVACGAPAQPAPRAPHLVRSTFDGRLFVPEGFQVTEYASVPRARFMALGPDGAVYVSQPREGQVMRLMDANGDGVAEAQTVAISGLNRPHGLAFHDGWFYIANTDAVVRVRLGADGRAQGQPETVATYSGGGGHWTRTVIFGNDGGMYVSIGSTCNLCVEASPDRAAVMRFDADGRNGRVFASGLRNAVGLAVHPVTGEIWVTQHERDNLPPDHQDLPPEEINILRDGAHYGWPYCYGDRIPTPDGGFASWGQCNTTVPPALEMQAHSAPLGITFLRNATLFPEEYRGDALVAFHGSWNRDEPTGAKVVRIRVRDGRPVGIEDFVVGWQDAAGRRWGRPVDVLVARDGAVLISDDQRGTIYRVSR